MNDSFFVRGSEGFGNLPGNIQGFIERNTSALDLFAERFTFDKFEYQVLRAIDLFQFVNDRDIRVTQGRKHLRFALESREPLRIVRKGLGQCFDGDVAAELCIAGAINLTHAARAQQIENLARTQQFSTR